MGSCFAKESNGPRQTGAGKAPTKTGKQPATEEDLRAVFKQFDQNGDGYIQEDELRSVMKGMGQNPQDDEIRAMFKAADANNDGQISFEEFCAIAKANPLQLSLRAVFGELDEDGDGRITRTELKKAYIKMGHTVTDDDILKVFAQADKNADSEISFEEFVSMMCKNRAP